MCRESRVFYCWDNTTFLAITNKPRGIASVKVVIAKIDILQLAATTTKNKTTHNLNNKIYVIWRNNKCG